MITATEDQVYDKKNPFKAQLNEKRLLNKEGSAKETLHFVVDLAGSGLTYTCGDSLGVFPTNAPEAVTELLRALRFKGDEEVTLPRSEEKVSIKEAFTHRLSLAGPTKKFLELLESKVTDPVEKAKLEHLLVMGKVSPDQLKAHLAEREFIDLIEEFPSASFSPQEFVASLKKLVPRLYSIASSPVVYPKEIHLTVAVVRYETNQRQRIGVCSTYLSDRCPIGEPNLPVFVSSSHFGLPEDEAKDIIMVGPGTGIAPFRAFVQERAALGSQGRSWLFFGDQHREFDFLYGDEWEKYLEEGKLNRLDLAFSRDQEHKIYVQDRMIEKGADLWEWLQSGAFFYVCGDAKRMASDVDQALHQIIEKHGNMSQEDAQAFVKQLKKEKRYLRDVY